MHHKDNSLVTTSYEWLKEWKLLIEQHLKSTAKENCMKQLKEYAINYSQFDNAQDNIQKIVDQVLKENLDVEATFETYLQSDHTNHPIWQELFLGKENDDVKEMVKKEKKPKHNETETEYEEMGDSILYSNVFTPPVDPISKSIIRDPCKNSICGHIYEYQYIVNYIKERKTKAKCPFIGCGNDNLSIVGLVRDQALKSQIQEYLDSQEAGPSTSYNDSDDDDE